MRSSIHIAALTASVILAVPAAAQNTGVTSGPSSGKPTTLGTGGETTATAHQTDSLKDKGGPAVASEKQGQAGGTESSVKPGAPEQESGTASRQPKPN